MTTRGTLIAAIALCAIPAAARAHGGNDDPNVVHACIGSVSKIVRIVGVTGSCITAPPAPLAEWPAHWALGGKDGTNGVDGTSVTFVDYFSGIAGGCANGGAIYAAGNPPVGVYVCNGTNGVDGKDGKDGTNATRADGPCFDSTSRYVDCGNGTVTDTVTGLIWLKQSNCLAFNTWAAANQAAAGLKNGDCGLTDNSSVGDWRLPTNDEWNTTIARAVELGCKFGMTGGAPSLTNDAGTACYGNGAGSSFVGVQSHNYWSSTSNRFDSQGAWSSTLSSGMVLAYVKGIMFKVWPVRSR